jgi:hypothetical protein
MESLNRRTLPNPAACATTDIGRSVSLMSSFAKFSLHVLTTAVGEAPRWLENRRSRWRGLTPRRRDNSATLRVRNAPSLIRRRARLTVAEVPLQAGVPGAASGRQRRHGRKPAPTDSAADLKNRTFARLALGEGQITLQ